MNELRKDREAMVRQVAQSRKILGNVVRMTETAREDNRKLYSEFKCTIEKEQKLETSTCEKLNASALQASGQKRTSRRSNSRLTSAASRTSLKF